VPIDLQVLFDHAYDTGPYRREINYHGDPVLPALRPDQAAWAAEVLARNVIEV
jgi:hypothetical protein